MVPAVNYLDEREKMRAAGIPGKLACEWLCTPLPGELVVVWVDRNARRLGAAADPADTATHEGCWDDFVPRYDGPFDTASHVRPGDFVTPREVLGG
jgi:hypothetical protein